MSDDCVTEGADDVQQVIHDLFRLKSRSIDSAARSVEARIYSRDPSAE